MLSDSLRLGFLTSSSTISKWMRGKSLVVEKYGLVVIANFESAQKTVSVLLGRWTHLLKGRGMLGRGGRGDASGRNICFL